MQRQKQTFVIPKYINEFKCIGPACEDICCIGWPVDIDRFTYEKYHNVQDEKLQASLKENIKRKHNSSYRFATIKMGENKTCPFLSDDHLCNIQLQLGESSLSDICSNYPRIINRVNGRFEKSAKMSCPEIARMALLNPDGIHFEEVEIAVDRHIFCIKDVDTRGNSFVNKPERYYEELRSFTIDVLQNRAYSLADRLMILTLFYHDVDEAIQSGRLNNIPRCMARYKVNIREHRLKIDPMTTTVDVAAQLTILQELLDLRLKKTTKNKRFLECYTDFIKGIQHTEDTSVQEACTAYQQAHDNHYHPFMKTHEYIFENYLVNYVFRNVFPFGHQTSIFREYTLMVTHYSLIKMILIGMAGFYKGLSEELVIKCIQSFSRILDHNQRYSKQMIDLLDTRGRISIELISTCVTN